MAGEDEVAIKPVLDQLRSFGVKSILDYSAEEDISGKENENKNDTKKVSTSETKDETGKKYESVDVVLKQPKQKPVARTYFYMNEANCEKNMDIFLRCIDAVAGATNHTGFAAIKLTALGRPGKVLFDFKQIILIINKQILKTRTFDAGIGSDCSITTIFSQDNWQIINGIW